MKKYRIHYTDQADPCCPTFCTVLKAYSKEHAEERFMSSGDSDGWRIVSIECVRP